MTIEPNEVSVDRIMAACIRYVSKGGGSNTSGLKGNNCEWWCLPGAKSSSYGLKYHAPMTTAHAVRSIPRDTPQHQSHTETVPAIDHPAQFLTCHSQVPLDGEDEFPMSKRRKERVKNGIDPMRVIRSIRGDSARRKGFAERTLVASFKIEDVVWSS